MPRYHRGEQVTNFKTCWCAQAAEGDSAGLPCGGGRGGAQRSNGHGAAPDVGLQDAGQAAHAGRSTPLDSPPGTSTRQAALARRRLYPPPRRDAVACALRLSRGWRQPPAHVAPAAKGASLLTPALPALAPS